MEPEDQDQAGGAAAAVDTLPEPREQLVVTLRKPISWPLGPNAITYTEVRLREPIGSEWKQWDGLGGNAANMMAVSVVGAIPLPVVEQIGSRDLSEMFRYLALFF